MPFWDLKAEGARGVACYALRPLDQAHGGLRGLCLCADAPTAAKLMGEAVEMLYNRFEARLLPCNQGARRRAAGWHLWKSRGPCSSLRAA